MFVPLVLALVGIVAKAALPEAHSINYDRGNAVYTAPKSFPTQRFDHMYHAPKDQKSQPRPVIVDMNGEWFPDDLMDPKKPATSVPSTEAWLPKPTSKASVGSKKLHKEVYHDVDTIYNSKDSKCDKCKKLLHVGQRLARNDPESMPDILIKLCKKYHYSRYGKNPDNDLVCERSYTAAGQGGPFTQLMSYADLSDGADGDYICSQFFYGMCDPPKPKSLSDEFLDHWFEGQRSAPEHLKQRSKRTGKGDKPLRVLWTSDIHLDPHYLTGGEANCTYGYCCHMTSLNTDSWSKSGYPTSPIPLENITLPAPYWGFQHCDAPWSLVGSAFEAIGELGGYDLALYTGDLVAHGETWESSRDVVKYSEKAIYDLFAEYLNGTTLIAAIGNHDTSVSEMAAQHALPNNAYSQYSWDWDYVSKLWHSHGWINDTEAEVVRTHYGGYSISPRRGLRVVVFNSDFWYTGNAFAFINTTNPDFSGVLRWVTDELKAAEEAHERVWVVAHILPGWDGYSTLDQPTNLFYQIVSRYSDTIAAMFFGHSHEDEFSVFYENFNGNSSSASRKTNDAVAVSFISPAITPLTNMNPGIRVLEVDPETYEIRNFDQYYTQLHDVQTTKETDNGLVWRHLYNARSEYGDFHASVADGSYGAGVKLDSTKWPKDAPLNATFWSAVADEINSNVDLARRFTQNQGRNSPLSPICDSKECANAKSCLMKSGSWQLGKQCNGKFSSVQG